MLNITDHTQILGLMAIEKCKLYEPSPGFCSFEKAPLTESGEFLHFQPSGSVFVISWELSQGLSDALTNGKKYFLRVCAVMCVVPGLLDLTGFAV